MEYSSANLIAFFYKNRKPLLGIPFLAMVVAVAFSGPKFIKPLFESQDLQELLCLLLITVFKDILITVSV